MSDDELDPFLDDLISDATESIAIKLRPNVMGAHVHIDVFIGADAEHLQHTGNLTMGARQARIFMAAVWYGAKSPALAGTMTMLPWPFEMLVRSEPKP